MTKSKLPLAVVRSRVIRMSSSDVVRLLDAVGFCVDDSDVAGRSLLRRLERFLDTFPDVAVVE